MAKESVRRESKIMVLRASCLLVMVCTVAALPQHVRLPEFQNFSPPEEVNAALLDNTPKVQRSISNHAGVDNTEDTIREVERLIKANPELPRLTRGEILDILDNITRQDHGNLLQSFDKDATNRDPKALMVVKAYTPLGSDGEMNVEALYTKPPITSIIEDEEPQVQTEAEPALIRTTQYTPHFRRKTTKPSEIKKPSSPTKRKPSRGSVQFKTTTVETSTPQFTSRRVTTTETQPSSTTEQVTYPTNRREAIKRRRRPIVTSTTTTTTTEMPVTTYRPRRRQPPRKEVQPSSHKHPAHRPLYSSEGIKVVAPPVMTTSSDQDDLLPLEMVHGQRFVPLPAGILSQQNLLDGPPDQSFMDIEIPENLKKVAADINLAAAQQRAAAKPPRLVRPATQRVTSSTTTTTAAPNAFAVADGLSPEMRELLKNFGLLPDPNEIPKKDDSSQFNPEKAEIDPKSYVGFKPLPQDSDGRGEMSDLLAEYGLLDNRERTSKSLRKPVKQMSLDMVPDNLKSVLLEMGLGGDQTRTGRRIRQQPLIKTADKDSESQATSQHVFTPEVKAVSEEDRKKLKRLLEIMKKLEQLNGTVSEEDVNVDDRKELKELIAGLKQQQQQQESEDVVVLSEQKAPNPVEFELGDGKNEVKRQEEEPMIEEIVTVTAESIPEETATASMKDLEESFGGMSDTATEALPEATTPRRSGFYYLLDWNTFFEIDDQKGKRVNLRFQPKVGDPKRFFSVNIP